MSYKTKNLTRVLIYEQLDTQDVKGNFEVLTLRGREEKVLTDAQWNSRAVQKLLARGMIRSKPA